MALVSPKWLRALERRLQWLAIPQIAILLITLQAAGFILVSMDPVWIDRLALYPEAVLSFRQYWRCITFLSLPLSQQPIWMLFVLWFLYFILNGIEEQWGAFKTTLYVLISILVTNAYSLATGYPVTQAGHFESTLFLAAAALFPDMEVRLFFFIPVKMKWMAWFTIALLAWEFARDDWAGRGYLLAMFSNYLLFFGPAALESLRLAVRRSRYRGKLR